MAITRTTTQQEELMVDLSFEEALRSSVEALQNVGKVKSIQEKFGRIVGSVGSGAFNMNNADITIKIETISDAKSKIVFIATAQEGLISQNTAAKAITRILDAF